MLDAALHLGQAANLSVTAAGVVLGVTRATLSTLLNERAHGATLCTLDQRLADAGPILGVPTQFLT